VETGLVGTLHPAPEARRVRREEARGPGLVLVRLVEPGGGRAEGAIHEALEASPPEAVVAPALPLHEIPEALPGGERNHRVDAEGKPALDADRLLGGELQAVGDSECYVYKPRWGAFYRTPLDAPLDVLGVDTVVVCGCNFPNCPRTTVYEASERDYRVVLVADATSGTYDRGLAELEDIGVAVMDTGEAVGWIE
jgi:nicotinamidase-related amidase